MSQLQDHHDIVQLTHAYCWALDEREWDALRDVFTPDAVTDLGLDGQNGIDEIIGRVSSALSYFDISQHQVATHQIQIEGDTASGRCYLHAQHVKKDSPGGDNLMIGARYEDDYVRTADGWRIAKRDIVFMWMEGNRAILDR
ncbi:MAG: nuclear transport factor 2 family protein [Actinomycetota bacterium]